MWISYNPNPTGRKVGDCAIRAVSKALGISWESAYQLVADAGYIMGERYSRYSREGGGNRGGQGGSYARGRNMNRDPKGRYSSDGYSYADGMAEMIDELRDMMDDLPQDKQREVQKFIQKMEM